LQSLSGLPTLTESGYARCDLAAPAKTPLDIVNKINTAVAKTLELPAVRTKLLRTGYVPTSLTPEQFGIFISDGVDAMVKLGKEAHIEPPIEYVMAMGYDLWWHIVRLLRKNNRARSVVNIFDNTASFNMLCLPKDSKIKVSGPQKIDDPKVHPLAK
jgi:Tripartite tricarboxylate transporter family receptor